MKHINIACFNKRYWSGNNQDEFIIIVDIFENPTNGKGYTWNKITYKYCRSFTFNSLEG